MIVLLINLIMFCLLDLLSDDHSRTYHRASTVSKNTSNSKPKSEFNRACISMSCHFILYILSHIYGVADVHVE